MRIEYTKYTSNTKIHIEYTGRCPVLLDTPFQGYVGWQWVASFLILSYISPSHSLTSHLSPSRSLTLSHTSHSLSPLTSKKIATHSTARRYQLTKPIFEHVQ